MKKSLLFFHLIFILGLSGLISGQDLNMSKSIWSATGQPSTVVTPILEIKNNGIDSVEVFVNRIEKNLPLNWTSCFCYIVCNPPTLDTLRFKVAAGQKAIIGIGFYTDSIPDLGTVKVVVEQVGGTQKDTLTFTGSTLGVGYNELSSNNLYKVFPNPANEILFIKSEILFKGNYQLINSNGSSVISGKFLNNEIRLNTMNIPTGNYFLLIESENLIESKQILIQH